MAYPRRVYGSPQATDSRMPTTDEVISEERLNKERDRREKRYEQTGDRVSNTPKMGGGLISSAGWDDESYLRSIEDPDRGRHDRWLADKRKYDEQMNSPETRAYLQQRSQEMGDTEFVGDLVDHLSSNRYYSNSYSDALAGEPTDLGPAASGKWVPQQGGGDPRARFADMYGSLVQPETWNNNNAGGKYGGAVDYNDDKFGLVKLGLYGTQGPSSYQNLDLGGKMYGILNDIGLSGEEVVQAMYDLREGNIDQENLDWLEGELGEGYAGSLPGSTVNQGWDDRGLNNPPPGVFFSEQPGWVGGFNYDSEETAKDGIFGKYTPLIDQITLSPDDKNVRETTVHELGHRGMQGLGRLDPKWVRDAVDHLYGEGSSGKDIWEDPTTGERFNITQFLENRGSTEGSYGQSPEHNLIDSVSRNRNNRNMYESFGTDHDAGDSSLGREISQGAYGVLGRVANAVGDYLQAGKKTEVDTMRNVGPQWYGGVTGSESSPLIPRRK